jgi:hypothetical protein
MKVWIIYIVIFNLGILDYFSHNDNSDQSKNMLMSILVYFSYL